MFKFNDVGRLIGEKKHEEAKNILVEQLVANGNNQVKAAKALGVDYRTFTRWLARLEQAGVDVRKAASAEIEKRAKPPEPEPEPAAPAAGSRARRVRPPVTPTGRGRARRAAS